jgi:hypothetical protein
MHCKCTYTCLYYNNSCLSITSTIDIKLVSRILLLHNKLQTIVEESCLLLRNCCYEILSIMGYSEIMQ